LITPAGDPSFLHPDFSAHPLFEKLKSIDKPLYIQQDNWKSDALAGGWTWEDYSEEFMTERSAFPVYVNQIHWYQEKSKKENHSYPGDTVDVFIYSNPEVDWPVNFSSTKKNRFEVKRDQYQNAFTLFEGSQSSASTSIPYITKGIETGISLLKDSLGMTISLADESIMKKFSSIRIDTIFSQPTDSLLKIMMHRSDNFYADQSLIMVSQQRFQQLDESAIIKEMLSNDLSGFPQQPRWIDGSGLSRYNLFSPDDMIYVLNKMRVEQPWERIKTIFPTVGTGTLTRFESKNGKFIYAKTGSMGGVMNLSGYIYTEKKKWLIFSIMINNTQTPFSTIRKQMNGFLEKVAEIN
jgi:D-alanyl-D-alanine carboxypeptidase/D-alanyl-D-alanine-endopeptidase (penicillin-binding protein 4)